MHKDKYPWSRLIHNVGSLQTGTQVIKLRPRQTMLGGTSGKFAMPKDQITLHHLATIKISLAPRVLGASVESLVVLIHHHSAGRVMIGIPLNMQEIRLAKDQMPFAMAKALIIS